MNMKLGINATGLYPGKVGGAEQYLRNILNELTNYPEIEVYLFLNETAITTFEETERQKLIWIDLSYNHDAQLKGYIALYNIDVWFCPLFHLIPVDCGIPNITTIFDIQQEYFPQNFDRKVLKARKRLTEKTVRRTDLILTISEYSKKTLMEKFGLPDEKIKVTYLDADSSFEKSIDPYILADIKANLPEQFILFPANMWPHKNHINLIKGYSIAKKKQELPLKLVFTGAQERESTQIGEAIEASGLRDQIVYLGYLPQEHMRYVFRCATMLAFPSLFEGFGIPLVEAMASDLPIICSTSSCVPEIVGDAGILFDGNSPEQIADAILKVYNDPELRDRLIQNGRRRRGLFSWEKCARETIGYIQQMYIPQKAPKLRISKHPKVSVITPSYNQGPFIRDTIESVLNQTYDNIEYIVMDGGSTDETVSILKEYGDRIKWVSEKDKGQADAVNKGIAVAKGEIIGWLNSDDTYFPEAVEKAVNAFISHPGYDMIYGEGVYIDKEGRVTDSYNTKMFDYDEFASDCFICQPTAFFTKEIVDKVGGLRTELQLCMDYELWMRIGKVGKILYIPERIATSRMYEENKTLSRRGEVYPECCREVKRHYGYVPHNWLVGYATYIAETHPQMKRRYYYLFLFLRYNYAHPRYFFYLLKQYARLRKQAKKPPVLSDPSEMKGKYADGWISKQYTIPLMCCGDENELEIKGRHLLPFPEPLVITVEALGKKKHFCVPENGAFQLKLRFASVRHGICPVTITTNQALIPSELGESNDTRTLSIIIDDVFFQKAEDEKPLVSIITPSYNQVEFIRDTIESVLNQDYENLEYIVVDGGSTDGTLDILKEYEGRLKYISEPDNGQSDAINKGFRMASGQIVAWLNSDDVYEPGCVRKAVKAFRDNPDASMIYGNGYIIDRAGVKQESFRFCREFSLWALVHIWDYIMQPATFFRMSDVQAVGYLDESLNWVMDWDLWIKLSLRRDVVYLSDHLACSREYGDTKTSKGMEKRLEEILGLMRRASGEELPFGYEIYYCSDLLAHYRLADKRREEVLHRLEKLLILQPAPDTEGRCTREANFMVRPYCVHSGLEVEITKDCEIPIDIYYQGELLEKRVFIQGTTLIPLPLKARPECTLIRAEIHSEAINNIGNQKDSWVRMRLVD